jgi:hypothetical protein
MPKALGFRASGVSDEVVWLSMVAAPGVERGIAVLDILGEYVS